MILLKEAQLKTIKDELFRITQQRKRIEYAKEEATKGIMTHAKVLRDIAFELSRIEGELEQVVFGARGAS
jgi:hypothetical protein